MNTAPQTPLDVIRCCSYNMHGFSNGIPMLQELCNNHEIILVQEHWFHDHELIRFEELFKDFSCVGISSMKEKMAAGLMAGRPFGGVAILWNNKLNFNMNIIHQDESGRYLSISLSNQYVSIIVHCVYFPCFSTKENYIVEITDFIAKIELSLNNLPTLYHVISGDFNFECNVNNKSYQLFETLLDSCNLFMCDSLNSSNLNYSYNHVGLGHRSWIDHCFVSSNLKDYISNFTIIDSGINYSDHLPISCSIKFDFNVCEIKNNTITQTYRSRWDKANLEQYYDISGNLLQSIAVPSDLFTKSVQSWEENSSFSFKDDINAYYKSIVSSILCAGDVAVPKIPANCLKEYWNDDLRRLKETSIDMHNLWNSVGNPRVGVINSARLSAKLKYKNAIKAAINHSKNIDSKAIDNCLFTNDSLNF